MLVFRVWIEFRNQGANSAEVSTVSIRIVCAIRLDSLGRLEFQIAQQACSASVFAAASVWRSVLYFVASVTESGKLRAAHPLGFCRRATWSRHKKRQGRRI